MTALVVFMRPAVARQKSETQTQSNDGELERAIVFVKLSTFSSILEDSYVLLTPLDVTSKLASVSQHQLIPCIGRACKSFVCRDVPFLACLKQ